MMKKGIIFGFLLLINQILFAEYILEQQDWRGGDGQSVFSDSTKFLSEDNISFDAGNLSLDYFCDTHFVVNPNYANYIYRSAYIGKVRGELDTLWVMGENPLKLIKTGNGIAWICSDTVPLNSSGSKVHDIQITEEGVYVAGKIGGIEQPFLMRSTDGVTWDTLITDLGEQGSITSILNLEGDTFLFAFGNSDEMSANSDGRVYKSTDACSSFNIVDTLSNNYVTVLKKWGSDTIFCTSDCNNIYSSSVFYSVDNGNTFNAMSLPDTIDTVKVATAMYITEINYTGIYKNLQKCLMIGTDNGSLYKLLDINGHWIKLDTANIIPDSSIIEEIVVIGNTLYVSTSNPGILYKSPDFGVSFSVAYTFPHNKINTPAPLNNCVYIGGVSDTDSSKLYFAGYYESAYLISSVFDAGYTASQNYWNYGIDFHYNKPRYTLVTAKIRSSSSVDMSEAMEWNLCDAINTENVLLTSLNSIAENQRYLQYRLDLATINISVTPSVESISIYNMNTGDSKDYEKEIFLNLEVDYRTQTLYLFSDENMIESEVSLYDLAGRVSYKRKVSKIKSGVYSINLRDITSGIYFIRLKNNNNFRLEKFTFIN